MLDTAAGVDLRAVSASHYEPFSTSCLTKYFQRLCNTKICCVQTLRSPSKQTSKTRRGRWGHSCSCLATYTSWQIRLHRIPNARRCRLVHEHLLRSVRACPRARCKHVRSDKRYVVSTQHAIDRLEWERFWLFCGDNALHCQYLACRFGEVERRC